MKSADAIFQSGPFIWKKGIRPCAIGKFETSVMKWYEYCSGISRHCVSRGSHIFDARLQRLKMVITAQKELNSV